MTSNFTHWNGHLIPEIPSLHPPCGVMSTSHRLIRSILSMVPDSWKVCMYDALTKMCKRANPHHQVYQLPFGLVLKITQRVGLGGTTVEADALRFMDTLNGVIHCPHYIDAVVADDNKSYLLSTWIQGETVAAVWDNLTSQDKAHLIGDLRDQFCRLRRRTTTCSHTICNASGSPIDDPRISWLADLNPRVIATVQDFSLEVWHGINFKRNETLKPLLMPLIERGVPVTFCHGDILPRNLIFPRGLESWRAGRSRIGIIDWECAGWMPRYWDVLKATWILEREDEWYQIARLVFSEDAEYLEADWEWRYRSGVQLV